MENSKRGSRDRGAAATDYAEDRTMQEQFGGQNSRSDRGHQGRRKRGRSRGAHSPSQRDDRRFLAPENDALYHEQCWRGHPSVQHHRGRNTWWAGPFEHRGQGWRGSADYTTHNPGKRKGSRKTGHETDESAILHQDLERIQQAERLLKREEIYHLKRNSHSSPGACFTCAPCEIVLDSISHVYQHIRDKRHKKKLREKKAQSLLADIPPPDPEHVCAVSASLEAVVKQHGMSDQDVEKRQLVVSIMQDLLQSVLPEITLRLYGSSCTKFGFKNSDVNIDIQYPPHMHQPDVLLLVKESLTKCSFFINLQADFHARVPVLICVEQKSGLTCKVSAGNENAFQTTSYLCALSKAEPVLLPLVLGLRHWAQICEIDHADEGGLPTYVFALLVIFFLQKRREPLLPTYLNKKIKMFSLNKLSDFNLTHTDDGFVHWIYSPSLKEPSESTSNCSVEGMAPLVFKRPNPAEEVGLLWIQLLRFYSLEFKMEDKVISVRTSSSLSREMKDWPKKRIAVEDPFAVKRNVARTVNSQQMFDYILHCFKTTYKYFALPLHTSAADQKGAVKTEGVQRAKAALSGISQLSLQSPCNAQATNNGPEDSDCIIEEEEEVEEGSDSNEEREKEKVDPGKSSVSEDDEEDVETHVRQHLDSFTTEDEDFFQADEVSGDDLLSDEEGPALDTPGSLDEEEREEVELAPVGVFPPLTEEQAESKSTDEKNQELTYEFTRQAFTGGKSYTVVCGLCKRDGHLKKDCPEDFKKVQLNPLPPLTQEFGSILNKVCEQCYSDFALDELEMDVRNKILTDLEAFVRRQSPGAKLQLFGSSKNGFGFRQSDLDICMMFKGRDTMDEMDCINAITSLAKMLKKHPDMKNIVPITTAKVPIVKFYHSPTGLEGDISLYNQLALHNTRLLASYAAIDKRVKIVCYMMKVFAKVCDIGDASRGSLSSYAYTLMVLFFLQQRNPPVIPVLQEIYEGKNKPSVLVDGWNVYFFDDLEALPGRWPHFGRNTETVGELWLGLLRFYTEEFDFREHVVCTRQHARLTTFNKQWTSKYLVIEDPFDLNHNLGAGLSRRMTNFIMKAFINGRQVFGTPVKVLPSVYPNVMEYFFDSEVLTEGQVAPNDRCCRICGKIGHFIKDCPMRKKPRPRRDSENKPEHSQDRRDPSEEAVDPVRHKDEHWKTRSALGERCCFLCGSNSHIKKDCSLYRGPAGNVKIENLPSARVKREKEKQGFSTPEDKKKKKQ